MADRGDPTRGLGPVPGAGEFAHPLTQAQLDAEKQAAARRAAAAEDGDTDPQDGYDDWDTQALDAELSRRGIILPAATSGDDDKRAALRLAARDGRTGEPATPTSDSYDDLDDDELDQLLAARDLAVDTADITDPDEARAAKVAALRADDAVNPPQ